MAYKLILATVLLAGACAITPVQVQADPLTLPTGQTVRVLRYDQVLWLYRWFPDNVQMMARIAWCESGFKDIVVGYEGERGRLQIHPIHAARFGYTVQDLADPEVNGYVGSRLLAERPDGSAWTTLGGCLEWSF